jgi:hypothetical protein
MNKFNSITKPLTWFMTLLMVAFVTGCSSGSTSSPPSTAKAITAYSIAGSTGVISGTATPYAIAVNVPNGTALTALVATFTTTGSSVEVGATAQVSGTTPNDFTASKAYIVTAADGSTATYNVTVTVSSATAKAITSYSLAGAFGMISGAGSPYDIAVNVPNGTALTALVATFSTTGSSVEVGMGMTVQVSGTTANDFTGSDVTPVAYTVRAADNSTVIYNVSVTVSASGNPIAPALGEAGRFVILASQKVTTTTGSAISDGDIGILDQARTYYEGFTEPAMDLGHFDELTNGYTYAHDDTSPDYVVPVPYESTIAFINQVRTDLGIAYTFLAADPNPGAATQVCPTQLGGKTLTPGVYKTAENVLLTTGALTLDAGGDANAVFIFSIDGTLTAGAPSGAVTLINNAQAKNVFFRTGGTTVIEAGIDFSGNVFAWSQVNALTGATITGRLFAVTDQVTLDANSVTKAP